MNNEQEIEKVKNSIGWVANLVIAQKETIAKNLVSKGIGDKKQAVKEFCEKLKENVETMVYEMGALPRDDERYKYSYEAVTVSQIDELFTELYGGSNDN